MDRIAVFAFAGLCFAGIANAQQQAAALPSPEASPKAPMARPMARTPHRVKCRPTGKCDSVRVHFATNSAALDNEAEAALSYSASCLKVNKNLRVTVEGRTDERGSADYNLALGQRRADAVATFLASRGVPSDQVSTTSIGKSRPLCAAHTETCWRENRAVAINSGTPVAFAEPAE